MFSRIVFSIVLLTVSILTTVNFLSQLTEEKKVKFTRASVYSVIALSLVLLMYPIYPSFIMLGVTLLSTCLVVFVFSFLTYKHNRRERK